MSAECRRPEPVKSVYMTTQSQDPRLGATAHLSMCENSSYNSYEPYEKYQPIGDAPMASLGGASRFSPPRTSWRERPQRSVSPSHGSRIRRRLGRSEQGTEPCSGSVSQGPGNFFQKLRATGGGELRSGPMNFERDFNSVSYDILIVIRLPRVLCLHILPRNLDR